MSQFSIVVSADSQISVNVAAGAASVSGPDIAAIEALTGAGILLRVSDGVWSVLAIDTSDPGVEGRIWYDGTYLVVSTGTVAVDVTAPTIVSAAVNSFGTQLSVVFSETVTGSTVPIIAGHSLTYVSGSGSTTFTYDISAVFSDEVLTLSYTSANIQDAASNLLANVSGVAITNNSLLSEPPPLPTGPASQGNVEFSFDGDFEVGNYIDGPAYIVVPTGTLTMNDPTPAVSSESGNLINGVMVNPVGVINGTNNFAFDQRNFGYNAANLATFPRTVTAGDIVVKAISEPGVANGRDGYIREWAACYIVSEAPAANEFAPTPFGWAGRGTPVGNVVDIDAALASLPSYDDSTYTKENQANTLARFDRYNPGLMATSGAATGGYQYMSVFEFGNPAASNANYGTEVRNLMDDRAMFLFSDATAVEKRATLIRMVQLGLWRFELMDGLNLSTPGDGGHFQWGLIPMLFGLKFSGRSAEIPDIATKAKDNFFTQAFVFDADKISRLAPHTNSLDPCSSRLRTISAISGNSITINGGISNYDPFHLNFYGLICCNAGGTEIGQVVTNASSSGASSFTVALTSAAGLSVSDQVYFKANYPISVGDYNWQLTGGYNTFNPSVASFYRELNRWSGTVLTARLLDVYNESMDAIEGYVCAANRLNYPLTSFDFPTHFPATSAFGNPHVYEFWLDHAVALIPRLSEPGFEVPTLESYTLSGSLSFGPENVGNRSYLHNVPTLPDSNWCIAVQFNPTVLIGRQAGPTTWLLANSSIVTGTGGNDWGIGYRSGEASTIPGGVIMRMGQSGVSVGTGTFSSIANVVNQDSGPMWLVFQRNGSTVEHWYCRQNATPVLMGTQVYNAVFGSRTPAAGIIGKDLEGSIGGYFCASKALTSGEIQTLGTGADPETVVPIGNRLSFISLATPAATITNTWGGNSATQNGDWTNRPTAGRLMPAPTGGQVRVAGLKVYQVFPRKFAQPKATPVIQGTYHNYLPAAMQYKIIARSNLSTVQDWTDFSSFAASGGTWEGIADIPEGGDYFLHVRDKNTTACQFLSDRPFGVAPMVVTTGQSPMARFDGGGAGIDTLTGSLYETYKGSVDTFIAPAKRPSASVSIGYVNLANQFSADSGGKPIAMTAASVGGTGAANWAGYANLVLGSAGSYEVGELVNITTAGDVFRGTGVVVSSSGTALEVKYLTVGVVATDKVVGIESGISRSVTTGVLGTANLYEASFPLTIQRLDVANTKNCDLTFYWLNGSSDTSTSTIDWNTHFDMFWDRLKAECAARNINPRLVVIPHQRQTSTAESSNFNVRKNQYDWTLNHPDFGTQVFLGWHYQDAEMIGELIGTAQAGTANSITLPASYEGVNSEPVVNITITAGTGAGQTRTGTTYVAATRVQTVTPNWTTPPDSTSQFEGWTIGPHQNNAACRSAGYRFGRSIAYLYGYTALTDKGPVISSVNRNGDGSVLTVNVTHSDGTALETPNGGASATNVFGFEVSEDDFATTETLTSVAITSANQITITLAAPPTIPANLKVRYLYGAPVSGANFKRLKDLVYDNQSIEAGRGQMLQTTFVPLTTTL